HERWLEKGFVLIKDDNNRLIKNVKSIKKNEDILIYFKDGKANAKVVNVFKKI
ncbi:MAG: exodeoxyribonuclease VII large subunit, partial [Rickettsiales bacterium]|nr:exodeoxyribonuclease VII large subunit [Rickettsiales bacterium]